MHRHRVAFPASDFPARCLFSATLIYDLITVAFIFVRLSRHIDPFNCAESTPNPDTRYLAQQAAITQLPTVFDFDC